MDTSPPRRRRLALLAVLLVLAALPLGAGWLPADRHDYLLQQLTTVMILGLLAMSLDLLVGIVGLVSLGHAAFYGLGAYLLVLLTPEYETPSLLTTAPLAVAGTALAALLVGAVVLRTGGIYFIMVTLAVGQMGFYLFNDARFAGGSDGKYLYFKPVLEIGGSVWLDTGSVAQLYYLVLAVLVLAYLFLRRMLEAPFGRVIRGIGVNEGRTRSLGYDVYAYKLVAYVIAGTLAGLAGVLAAAQYGFVNPTMLGWHMSGSVLVTVILGGMGTLLGPVAGAFAVELLRHGLEALTTHWLLPYGLLVILMVLALPRGLAGLPAQLATLRVRVRRPALPLSAAAAVPKEAER